MLDGNGGCEENILDSRDVEPEEGHDEGKGDCGEEVPVLRVLVEYWRVLEDAEPARAHTKKVEPLHDHQVDEVD